jgi:hypothetical protein
VPSRGALLQQAQAVESHRHLLRKRERIYQDAVDGALISIWLRDPVP